MYPVDLGFMPLLIGALLIPPLLGFAMSSGTGEDQLDGFLSGCAISVVLVVAGVLIVMDAISNRPSHTLPVIYLVMVGVPVIAIVATVLTRNAANRERERNAAEIAIADVSCDADAGQCPNCNRILLQGASVCPHCNAAFSAESIWKIKPIRRPKPAVITESVIAPSKISNAPAGLCPNCEGELPTDSSTCPHCTAAFGPGSTWKIRPLKP